MNTINDQEKIELLITKIVTIKATQQDNEEQIARITNEMINLEENKQELLSDIENLWMQV